MQFTLALAQTKHPQDGDVVALVQQWASRAAQAGAQLLVFPESLMSRYEIDRGDFIAQSQPVGGPFCQAVEAVAVRYGLWILYTMNELNTGDAECSALDLDMDEDCDSLNAGSLLRPFNTAILVDDQGVRRGVYRKVHLFDTDFTQESSRMSAGDVLFNPIDTPFGRIGMAICYDLRFPEVARFAALRGCDLMIYSAAWVDGPQKVEQWRSLLAARAVENQMYVAGLSRCDKGYIGNSAVYGPDALPIAQAGSGEELLLCSLDCCNLADFRAKMPVLEHRRPALY